jgi:hypothetical protein
LLESEDDFVIHMKSLENAIVVCFIPGLFHRGWLQSLAAPPISQDKYFAAPGPHSLLARPAGDGEAIKEAEKVMGSGLESPPSSLMVVTRWDLVQEGFVIKAGEIQRGHLGSGGSNAAE